MSDDDLCRMGDGRPVKNKKNQLCSPCYSHMRVLSNVKTPKERATYTTSLILRLNRVNMVEQKVVVIGTAKHRWKPKPAIVVQFRRQRGPVR